MKTQCCLIVALAMLGLAAARPPMQNILLPEYLFMAYIDKCLDETVLYKTSEEIMTKDTQSCFMACVFEESGIIKPDGSVTPVYNDVETMEIIDNCKVKAQGNNCKLAWCLQHADLFDILRAK